MSRFSRRYSDDDAYLRLLASGAGLAASAAVLGVRTAGSKVARYWDDSGFSSARSAASPSMDRDFIMAPSGGATSRFYARQRTQWFAPRRSIRRARRASLRTVRVRRTVKRHVRAVRGRWTTPKLRVWPGASRLRRKLVGDRVLKLLKQRRSAYGSW